MKILITNDDGISASGVVPFVKWAKNLGEVTVIAPKTEQSGKSHGIQLRFPFEVEEIDLLSGVTAFSVDSTPADCIRFAFLGLKGKFDLALSGVNRGYNLGQDLIYSGTVGAATEAAYMGLPAVAISADVPHYDSGGVFRQLDCVWDFFVRNSLLSRHQLYNVNIPPDGSDFYITRQGGPYYSDEFPKKEGKMYQAKGKCVYERGSDLSIDTHCVMNGHISVSPLSVDRTDMRLFDKLLNCK